MAGLASLSKFRPPEDSNPTIESVISYDVESTNAEAYHGQILQFAAVEADADLNPTRNHSLRIRRLPYVVPHPEALAVNGLAVSELDDPALPSEFDAAKQISSILKPSPETYRTFITFNGIRYDDLAVRVALFRNLLDPYVQSGKNTCRVDMLNTMQLAVAGQPEDFSVQVRDDGRRSWKLESLCDANGIEIVAHEALSDSLGALGLARLVMNKAPWAWSIAKTCGTVSRVEARLDAVMRQPTVVYSFSHFGAPDLGPHLVIARDDKRSFLLVDLRKDLDGVTPDDLPDLDSVEERNDAGLKIVRAAAAPLFVPESEAHRFGDLLPREELQERAQRFLARSDLISMLSLAFRQRTFLPREDATSEELIYAGFVSNEDKRRLSAFHGAPTWDARSRVTFDDPRLQDFAARILAMTGPARDLFGADPSGILSVFEQRADRALSRPFSGEDARWETLAKCYPVADEAWREWAHSAFRMSPEQIGALSASTLSP